MTDTLSHGTTRLGPWQAHLANRPPATQAPRTYAHAN